jgi:hypothetical protein
LIGSRTTVSPKAGAMNRAVIAADLAHVTHR